MNAVADTPTLRLSPNELPAELLTTDRILLRWAASIGDGKNDASWQELVRAKVPELPFDVAIVVDKLVLRAPPSYRLVTELWYRTPSPREVIGMRLGVSRHEVYNRWRLALYHFRRHFETSPLTALRNLAIPEITARAAVVRECLTELADSKS